MNTSPQCIVDMPCHTGENPLWHPELQRLFWTDIPAGELFSYDPTAADHRIEYRGLPVGGFTLQTDGSLLLFRAYGNVAIWRDWGETVLVEEILADAYSRFNDVVADPMGRVFAGTMPTGDFPGRLYRFDLDGSYHLILKDVRCSNGMGFTPDGSGMYFIDTPTRRVDLFDYDPSTGDLSNRRLFADTSDRQGFPDGMTVDADGHVWVAFWDGYGMSRYDPEGKEERHIELPVKKVSSLTFGGPDYEEIYITTAGGNDRADNGALAGSLYHLRQEGIRGVPEFRSRVGDLR